MTARAAPALPGSASPSERGTDLVAAHAAEWLPMRDAIALLGVSSPTLRRWADAGRITTWTTPGGHRRFARSALLNLLTQRHARSGAPHARTGGGGRVMPETAGGGSEMPAGASPASPTAGRWLEGPARSLLVALVGCLQADAADRPAAIRAAETTANEIGARARSAGVPPGEVAAVIHGLRLQILEALASSARIRGLPAHELSVLLVEAVAILDPVLDRSLIGGSRSRSTTTSVVPVPNRS